MLRNRLFKRFGKDGLQEPVDNIPSQGIKTADTYPTIEELASRVSNPNYRPLTQSMLGIGTIKDEAGYEKQNGELNINAGMFEPKKDFGIPTYNFSIPGSRMSQDMRNQEQTLREGEVSSNTPKSISTAQNISGVVKNQYNPKPKKKDFNFPGIEEEITLGLAALDSALGYNQDLENQRKFNESIQQRKSKPLYDYNYMYGRTTSGGTEYQPTIKAEMGAKINKRYSSGGDSNVEIEGGEFIQLPNFETEMATGPSHSNGGIPTNLPDQTRVYSNSLKPEGSKKTFAQMAKNYDITSYKKTLDNPFAKQVDKDTAGIMMQRNQKILDSLFNDQQILNGDSNGEMEAKKGASINNAGFRALPKNVQEKILAEMQYGGYAKREAASLEMKDGADVKDPIPTYQPGTRAKVAKMDPKTNLLMAEVPGLQSTLDSGVYGQESNLDLFKKNFDWFIKDQEAQGQTFDPKNKEQMRMAQVAYNEEIRNRALKAGYTPEEADKFASEMGFVPEEGNQRSIDSKLGLYTASRQLPNFEPKTPVPPGGDNGVPPDGTKINDVTPGKTGKYTPGNFPLYQAIPEAMGLAQAQEIYSYAIPEVDAPYIRPQTLNIQSELQDINNMGTAAIRAGADPNMAYIAGLDAKQKAFQTKQNYDAEGRSKADIINAQMTERAGQFNAGAFDKVYNNLVGQARDAQSAEKQAAVANLVNKKGKFEQDENLKALGIPIVSPGFNWNSTGNPSMPEGMRAAFEMYNYMKEQDAKKAAEKPKAKKGMYKK